MDFPQKITVKNQRFLLFSMKYNSKVFEFALWIVHIALAILLIIFKVWVEFCKKPTQILETDFYHSALYLHQKV